MSLVSGILDLLAPARCLRCETILRSDFPPLCGPCERGLPWWRQADGCPRCGSRMPLHAGPEAGLFEAGAEGCPGCLADGSALHACYSLLRYDGPARLWIPGFKRPQGSFGPPHPIRTAIDYLARTIARRIVSAGTDLPDHIAPIPLHARRRRERGFDHAASIAHRIARELGRPHRPATLVRVRATTPQASLRGRARRENVRDAFRATTRLAPGTRVWLVDDVLTTGSTLEAGAESLLEAGAEEVRALTLAATLPARRRLRGAGIG